MSNNFFYISKLRVGSGQFEIGSDSNIVLDGYLRFTGDTSGTLTHDVPSVITDYTIIWPATQASGTQFLQNDGSGNLSWATVAADTLQSAYEAGNTIATDSGNGSVVISGTEAVTFNTTQGINIQPSSPGSNDAVDVIYNGTGNAVEIGHSGSSGRGLFIVTNFTTSASFGMIHGGDSPAFEISHSGDGDGIVMSLTDNANANKALEISHSGLGPGIDLTLNNSSNASIGFEIDYNGTARAMYIHSQGTQPLMDLVSVGSTNAIRSQSNGTVGTLSIRNTDTSGMVIDLLGATSGTLGIAVPNAVTSYDLILPDSQASGTQFLQNDGSGNLSWETVSLSMQEVYDTDPVWSGTDTMQFTKTGSGAALYIDQNGSGVGIQVDSGNGGITINQAGSDGLTIIQTGGGNAIRVLKTSSGSSAALDISQSNAAGSGSMLSLRNASSSGHLLDLRRPDDTERIHINVSATSSSYDLILPTAQASGAQFLQNDGSGNLSWQTVQTELVNDATPQLGGDLDVNGNKIVSASNGNIELQPDGTGVIILNQGTPTTVGYVWTATGVNGEGEWDVIPSNDAVSWTTLIVNSNTNANSDEEFAADSSGGSFTVTLPASPTIGDRIRVVDPTSSWAANNVTIDRNGENIDSVAQNFILDVDDAWAELVYIDSTTGWKSLTQGAGSTSTGLSNTTTFVETEAELDTAISNDDKDIVLVNSFTITSQKTIPDGGTIRAVDRNITITGSGITSGQSMFLMAASRTKCKISNFSLTTSQTDIDAIKIVDTHTKSEVNGMCVLIPATTTKSAVYIDGQRNRILNNDLDCQGSGTTPGCVLLDTNASNNVVANNVVT